jgi:hypothetical protein
MRAGQEVADLGFHRGNARLRSSKKCTSSLIEGAKPPSRSSRPKRPDDGWAVKFPAAFIVIYAGNICCCNVPLSAFLGQECQWFLGALPSPPNQGQCTLASTSRAQSPIRRDTALRWPNTRLEVPGRGRSPHTGRAGGPGTVIAMDMTRPGNTQASVRDPIAHRRGAEAVSPRGPQGNLCCRQSPQPGARGSGPLQRRADGSLPLTGNGRIGRGSCARPGLGALIDLSESRSADSCPSFPVWLRVQLPIWRAPGGPPSTPIPPFNRPLSFRPNPGNSYSDHPTRYDPH